MGVESLKSVGKCITAEQKDTNNVRYALIQYLPASVLLYPSKRLVGGFRSAPASLLANIRHNFLSGPQAKCDAEGLYVRFAGYIVTGT